MMRKNALKMIAPIGAVLLLFSACTEKYEDNSESDNSTLKSTDENVLEFPEPSGSYSVGCYKLFFTDESRGDVNTLDSSDKRKISCKVLYPSLDSTCNKSPYYVSETIARLLEASYSVLSTGYLTDSLKNHAYKNLQPAKNNKPFPVLFFSHAYSGPTILYSSLLEDLCSQGFIIVAVSHPYDEPFMETKDGYISIAQECPYYMYDVLPDSLKAIADTITGEEDYTAFFTNLLYNVIPNSTALTYAYYRYLIKERAKDILFVKRQIEAINANPAHFLSGIFDTRDCSVFGHSLGGATSAYLVSEINTPFKTGCDLDGALQIPDFSTRQFQQPFNFIMGDRVADGTYDEVQETLIDSIISRSTDAARFDFEDIVHEDFALDYYLIKNKGGEIPFYDTLTSLTRSLIAPYCD